MAPRRHSLEWLLREAAAGEIFAAGHAESGNDLPVLLSTSKAERVDGGYRFTGRKHFGSLTPVWTRFGLHGMDTSDPTQPKVVHAFMPRDTAGYTIKETWDVLGMRATRSDDTVLDNVFVPDRYIARVVPAGAAGIDSFYSLDFRLGVDGLWQSSITDWPNARWIQPFASVKEQRLAGASPARWRITRRFSTPLPIWSSNSNPSGRIWKRSPRIGRMAWITARMALENLCC